MVAVFISFALFLVNTLNGEPNIPSSPDQQWPSNCSRKKTKQNTTFGLKIGDNWHLRSEKELFILDALRCCQPKALRDFKIESNT